jgi:hypothetical protein
LDTFLVIFLGLNGFKLIFSRRQLSFLFLPLSLFSLFILFTK